MFEAEEFVQLVTETGIRQEHPLYSSFVTDIDAAALRDLYEDLVVVRRIDSEATALQRQGELGLWAPLRGQEAAQVGSARALETDDFAFPSYREHGVAYCRGVDPAHMLRFWRGSTHSGWDPFQYRMTTPAIVVGSQALHAVGYAMGIDLDSADSAVITYFGDGATSQGDISEALCFAASFAAPVVFFCQNNQWAISEPVSLQSRVTLSRRGPGFGIPAVRVDGNDVLAVLATTRAALQSARKGNGPILIEAVTYRMGPHTTSDDPSRYRPSTLDEDWRRRDPLDRIRNLLETEGAIDTDFLRRIEDRADATAAALRRGCLETIEPQPLSMFDNVYAQPHPLIDEERDQFATYLSTLEEAEQ
ncbi:pyruvate dehydrogenase (acetyl-transferring) E1 component subunit alpha [Mycolicibacterium helvum]|uniref:pyruvate dehydrogenase (acetyl-transferring) E1 component subunit alpha n=1 Tax=Mycolicibacterium helvum TaxID=1534349 RepID=UPI0013D2EF4C|nr:pyruvate dehydrogenase (acetyl-transferring) E1 component subunit alpha [Mycolicibacterium helvum]